MAFNRDNMVEDAVLSGRRFHKEKRCSRARRRERAEEFFSEIEVEDQISETDQPAEF